MRGLARPLPVEGQLEEREPEPVAVDLERLDAAVRSASDTDRERWEVLLCVEERTLFLARARERRAVDAELERAWARIVYDVVGASLRAPSDTARNVRALLPLYFARVAAHVRASERMTSAEAEGLVEAQAAAFEAERAHLTEKLAA